MAKGDDIEARLVKFAVGVLQLCERISNSAVGSHISGKLMRSATSAASNYAEAQGAKSANDFIHKLGIVLKELNESRVWLQIVQQHRRAETAIAHPLLEECISISKIITVSRRTAARNAGRV